MGGVGRVVFTCDDDDGAAQLYLLLGFMVNAGSGTVILPSPILPPDLREYDQYVRQCGRSGSVKVAKSRVSRWQLTTPEIALRRHRYLRLVTSSVSAIYSPGWRLVSMPAGDRVSFRSAYPVNAGSTSHRHPQLP